MPAAYAEGRAGAAATSISGGTSESTCHVVDRDAPALSSTRQLVDRTASAATRVRQLVAAVRVVAVRTSQLVVRLLATTARVSHDVDLVLVGFARVRQLVLRLAVTATIVESTFHTPERCTVTCVRTSQLAASARLMAVRVSHWVDLAAETKAR